MKQLFFLFTITCIGAAAQVPGYLGKRFSVTLNYCIGIPNRFLPANASDVPYKIDNDGPNLWYKINTSKYLNIKTNYVVSQSKELELSIRHSNLGLTQIFVYKTFPSSTGYNKVEYDVVSLDNTAFGLSLRKTLKGIISPLGYYLLIGLSYNKSKITDPNLSYEKQGLLFEPVNASFIDLHLGLGVNYLVSDKFIINISMDSYLNDYLFTLPQNRVGLADNSNDFAIKKVIKGRVFSSNFLTASAGIGYLIF